MGDCPTTFHEIYQRYAGDVFRFAYWLSGDSAAAADITSETFVRAWTALDEPRPATVKTYLFTIARNLHLKQSRRQARQEELDECLPDPAAPPDEALARKEECDRALAAMQVLPEMDRTLLLMRAQEGISYADIAAATGLSVTAAKVRVFRAREKLAAHLRNETNSPP